MDKSTDNFKTILYLSYDGLSDPLGQSQILPYLIRLSKAGYSITLITFEKKSRNSLSIKKLIEICRDNRIIWIARRYHKYPPVISTLFDIWILHKTADLEFNKFHHRIIHCRSYITSLAGMRLKYKYGAKFIFDMRGFWADERADGGIWNLRNPVFRLIYKYFKRKEREFIVNADQVISLTHNAKKEMQTWFEGSVRSLYLPDKISVIPTCVDTRIFDPGKIKKADQELIYARHGISRNSKILLYLGSLGTWYMLDAMLDFYDKFSIRYPDSVFIILSQDKEVLINTLSRRHWKPMVQSGNDHRSSVSNSAGKEYSFGMGESHTTSRVILSNVGRDMVPVYISISYALICFILPKYSKKASSATKIGEVLSMGKPVITNAGWGDIDQFIDNRITGIIINQDSSDNYNSAISQLESFNFSNSAQIREKAVQRLSLENGVDMYDRIYRSLLIEK